MSNSVWLNFSSLSMLFRVEGFSCDTSVLHVGVVLSQATPWSNLRTKIDSNTDCVDRMWAGHVECPGPLILGPWCHVARQKSRDEAVRQAVEKVNGRKVRRILDIALQESYWQLVLFMLGSPCEKDVDACTELLLYAPFEPRPGQRTMLLSHASGLYLMALAADYWIWLGCGLLEIATSRK